jgi:hypothetical protein
MTSIVHLTDQRRYHLYIKETDVRKGFGSLCGIIRNELNKQVMNGDAFRRKTNIFLCVAYNEDRPSIN